MLKNYFNTTIRNLLRNRVYSAINIVGLSLGLACAILIILYTNDELSYDRFHENADNIYRVTNKWIDPDGTIRVKEEILVIFKVQNSQKVFRKLNPLFAYVAKIGI